jgi:hypothetical protein
MPNRPETIVNTLLEAEQLDAHVKAYDRIKSWDGAYSTYHDLRAKHLKARALFDKMGVSIAYERALAKVGLAKDQVDAPIRLNSFLNSTLPKEMPAKAREICLLALQRMRHGGGMWGNVIIGARGNDGASYWFDEPVTEVGQELPKPKPKLPATPVFPDMP